MATSRTAAKILDFSNVKERGEFNTRHIEAGEYIGKITKVTDTEAKDGEDMWVFTVELEGVARASYPYYCKLVENQLWKVRALFEAIGTNVGKRKLKVNPQQLVGKKIGVFMEDDEYEGKLKSVIAEVLSADEVEPAGKTKKKRPVDDEDEDLDALEEEEEIEDETEDLEEDEEVEEEEEEKPAPRKRAAKKAPAKAPARRTRRKAPVDDDEEEDDEELDIDEL